MNKKIKLLTTSLLVVGALTACNTNPQKKTAMDRTNVQKTAYDHKRTSNYGYNNYPNTVSYTPGNRTVTDRYTDMDMQRVTYPTNHTDRYGNVKYSKINQDIKQGRTNVGYNYYNDRNYHGQMATPSPAPTRNVTMNNSYMNRDGKLAETISNRVRGMNGVDRVSTVAHGNDVLVAVKARTGENTTDLENRVRQAVIPYAKGRTVHVSANPDMYNRVSDMSTRLRNGTITNDMNRDLTNMFNALRTPRPTTTTP
ncbi:YhcN/YlaJ family sporulation lipoprotein [Microbacteriaceae bacterium 4G12]